jgi:VWFA-related protein
VTVTVADDAGRFVSALPRSAFTVYEDGKPQPITYFASKDVPLELIVAVDISGSMTASMVKLKKAVKDFLVAVPSKDQVTLLGFNDSVFALTRKTTDPSERVRAVDRLAPWGATALSRRHRARGGHLGRPVGRKALVFSDGEDQGGASRSASAQSKASDVTLYLIAQGRGITARTTCGRRCSGWPCRRAATFTDSVDQLHTAFKTPRRTLESVLLGYQPTNGARDTF